MHAMAKGPIFVDTMDALNETGDLTGPIAAGVIQPSAIKGTLAALCKGDVQGRTSRGPDHHLQGGGHGAGRHHGRGAGL